MQAASSWLIIISLAASSALAQQTDRVLHFAATTATKDLQEIATVICAITDIPQTSVDSQEKALPLHGTAGQIALAEWLLINLDKPAAVSPDAAKHEYRVSDSSDDMVRVFYLTNPEIPTGVQEIAIVVRSLAGVRQMFTYNDLRAVVVRGTSEQINLAEFLFAQMDKPGIPENGASAEFRMGPDSLARVFYLPKTKTDQDFQVAVTVVRTIAQLRYAFSYSAARAVAMRGTDEQVALAKWLFEDLDGAKSPDSGVHQYQLLSSSDEFVRVFYRAHDATSQRLGETLHQIESKTQGASWGVYTPTNAIVIRGTAQQIAGAAELIQQQDN
jgi:type II secretory pathway component GspD/PulD (secretin)